jgi:ammonia channel protein AmtB
MGNWLHGGGWLMHLGQTLQLGQGYRDDGLVSLFVVGAGASLAGITALKRTGRGRPAIQDPELPRAYLPLNVLIGAFLALLGWCVVLLNQSLAPTLDPLTALPRLFAALAASVLTASFYGWLVRGRPDVGLTGRAMLAALILASAGIRTLPVGIAALGGALCGLLLAPLMYLLERVLRLDDHGAALSVHGLPALAGLLLAAMEGGLSQLYAQLVGVGALLVLSALLPWAVMLIVARAYTLPAELGAALRARNDTWAAERYVRAQRRLQGQLPSLQQRLNRLYRRRAAHVARRRMARPAPERSAF